MTEHPGNPTISPGVCTEANVFCWMKRIPAPREDRSISTIGERERHVLVGNNPIRTYIFENDHVLHDPLQLDDCAEHVDYETINGSTQEDLRNRCSYVHREVRSIGSDILIRTHGEGNNPGVNRPLNEIGGEDLFYRTDRWIQRRLSEQGHCPDDP